MDEVDNDYDNDDDDQIIPSTELINIVDVDGDENEDGIFSSTEMINIMDDKKSDKMTIVKVKSDLNEETY